MKGTAPPRACGLNGFAPVLDISLAPLVLAHHGQKITLAVAVLCYLLAWLVVRSWRTSASPGAGGHAATSISL
ncbi:hypothetical protein [Aquisalimonas sp.]|uniref:hypothetical protein n=1 Tax=Aquisalimonas sp. TaxID=1872621 RepID=UPI0025C30C51|nr:hypothetical protein [Aquisalimonas sp.]